MMKKLMVTMLALLMCIVVLTGCSKSKATLDEEAMFLVGTWSGEDFLDETWTFNEDGSGKNDNSLLAYDFDFEYEDGVLSIYSYFGSMKSDTPSKYSVTVNSETEIVLTDENDTEYVLTK